MKKPPHSQQHHRKKHDIPVSYPGTLWLYGKHPCLAALQNKERHCTQILVTSTTLQSLEEHQLTHYKDKRGNSLIQIEDAHTLDKLLPEGAVHQGIAVAVQPLPGKTLADICKTPLADAGPVIVLDQVTDPHNVGAILRSAAAFNALAVIVTKHHSPQETGLLAKIACGALEVVPIIKVTNLAQALEELKSYGYWCIGLDSYAEKTLAELDASGKTVLILGAEDKGLRQLTRTQCDFLAKLPIHERMESLNVSNAAAVAMYEIRRQVSTIKNIQKPA